MTGPWLGVQVPGWLVGGAVGLLLMACGGSPAPPSSVESGSLPVATGLVPSTPAPLFGAPVSLTPTFRNGSGTIGSTGTGSRDITASAQSGRAETTSVLAGPATFTLTVSGANGATATTSCRVTPQSVQVGAILPADSRVGADSTTTFTANATGGALGTVTWAATGGTFNGNAWKAPGTAGTFTITATSADDPSKQATTTVTVTLAGGAIVLNPAGPVHLAVSGTLALLPQVTGVAEDALVWSVDGIPGGNASVGILAPNGRVMMYTAPSIPGSHTLLAASKGAAGVSAAVTATVGSTWDPTPASSLTASVKDSPYNAKGDGITDDTKAIQAAVDAMAGTGGTVTVPAGTYLIDPTWQSATGIQLRSSMTFSLAPEAVLKARPTSTSHYVMLLLQGVHDVTVSGGSLLGNRKNNTITDTSEAGFGLQILGSRRITVNGITVADCWCDGFYVGQDSTDITLTGVVADGNRRSGISITSVDNLVLRGSTFRNSVGLVESGVFVCGTGADLEPNAGETVSHVQILDCTCTANPGSGILVGPAVADAGSAFVRGVVIDGSTFSGNGLHHYGSGIEMAATPGNQVSNNTVTGNIGIGIYLRSSADDTLVFGNTVSGTLGAAAPDAGWKGFGIELSRCGGNTVTGNVLSNNAASGLVEYGSTGTNVTSPNTLVGNGGQ